MAGMLRFIAQCRPVVNGTLSGIAFFDPLCLTRNTADSGPRIERDLPPPLSWVAGRNAVCRTRIAVLSRSLSVPTYPTNLRS